MMTERLAFCNKIDDLNDLSRICETLKALPYRLREAAEITATAQEPLALASQDVTAYELMVAQQISEELDLKSGKPRYSNAEARKAELSHRLQHDETYSYLTATATKAKVTFEALQFEERRLVNEFAALRVVASAKAARLTFMAAIFSMPDDPLVMTGGPSHEHSR